MLVSLRRLTPVVVAVTVVTAGCGDKETNDAPYGPWVDTRNATMFIDNPCFHTNLLSDTAFDVNHNDC